MQTLLLIRTRNDHFLFCYAPAVLVSPTVLLPLPTRLGFQRALQPRPLSVSRSPSLADARDAHAISARLGGRRRG